MKGLLEYLAGPGRANEHTEAHLVAGDSAVMGWFDDAELSISAARDVAVMLDRPRRELDVDVPGGSVWHCSLSVRAGEDALGDEKWADIARDFVDEMGFSPTSGKAGCRWVAVHHGVSKNGNDHVHLAVSLVRDDGTKASTWHDYARASKAASVVERRYGLEVLESRAAGRGEQGVSAAEIAKAERVGAVEPERFTVARTVRAAAAASGDEAEFVRRARRAGLLVRPRYASGREDVVLGYSAALRPGAGQRPVWFGGGHLARDLSLPRLRDGWADTPQAATAAAAEWNAARRARRPVAPGREAREVDPALWDKHTTEVAALRQALRAVPVDDVATWARVAHDGAGTLAAWSLRIEATPGPLAAAADCLARSASIRAHRARGARGSLPSARGASLLVSSIAAGGVGTVAQAVLLRQVSNTIVAVHDAHKAIGQAQRAREIRDGLRADLRVVRASLPAIPSPAAPVLDETQQALALAQQAQALPPGRGGPVLPADLTARRARVATHPGARRDFER